MTPAPRILLVDDDEAIRESFKFSLELEGLAVATFDSAEAVAADADAVAADCLVLDYRLPGIDGLQCLAQLRRSGVTAPAIIITTTPTRTVRERAEAVGAMLIEKPLLCGALSAAIWELVRPARKENAMEGPEPKFDAISEESLTTLVNAFYAKVRLDPMIGPVFNRAIDDWPEHLVKLQAFWSSVMLTSGRYKGRPLPAHIKHAGSISAASFERWLALWRETTEELLDPASAAALQEKAGRIAESLSLGIAFHTAPNGGPPVLRTAAG